MAAWVPIRERRVMPRRSATVIRPHAAALSMRALMASAAELRRGRVPTTILPAGRAVTAGLCLAHGLRLAGVDVQVLERRPSPADQPASYGIHLNPHGPPSTPSDTLSRHLRRSPEPHGAAGPAAPWFPAPRDHAEALGGAVHHSPLTGPPDRHPVAAFPRSLRQGQVSLSRE